MAIKADNVHQSLGRFAPLLRKIGNLLQGEDVRDFAGVTVHIQFLDFTGVLFQFQALWFHFIRT